MSPVVLITGASSGIGEATARRLHAQGWCVALAARRRDRLEALARELDPTGRTALALPGDLTQAADRGGWIAATLQQWGRLDALVNNAGYGQRGPVELVPLADLRRNFEVNVFALVGLTQLALPHLRRARGRIVLVGSVAGRIARPFSSVYDSTKHALEALADGLREELRPHGVRVVLIRPGFIVTEFMEAANAASQSLLADAGPYAAQWQRKSAGMGRLRRWAGCPDDIAGLVQKALRARCPAARYAGPLHAKVFLALKRLLPGALFQRMMRAVSS